MKLTDEQLEDAANDKSKSAWNSYERAMARELLQHRAAKKVSDEALWEIELDGHVHSASYIISNRAQAQIAEIFGGGE